jgi:hypothetical protein
MDEEQSVQSVQGEQLSKYQRNSFSVTVKLLGKQQESSNKSEITVNHNVNR